MPKSDSRKKKPRGRIWLIVRFLLAATTVACAVAWLTLDPRRASSETVVNKPKFAVDSSPEKQSARRDAIDELIRSRVFDKVDQPVTRPHVYVSDRWRRLEAEEKLKALGVVLAYYHVRDPGADLVIVRDAATGERIGMFSEHGLELDD